MFRQQMASEPVSSSQFPSKQIDGGFWSFRSKIFPRIFSRQKSTSRHLLPCALVRKAHRLWAETGENSVKWRGGRFLFLCALSFLALLLKSDIKVTPCKLTKKSCVSQTEIDRSRIQMVWNWMMNHLYSYSWLKRWVFFDLKDVWFLIKLILWNVTEFFCK